MPIKKSIRALNEKIVAGNQPLARYTNDATLLHNGHLNFYRKSTQIHDCYAQNPQDSKRVNVQQDDTILLHHNAATIVGSCVIQTDRDSEEEHNFTTVLIPQWNKENVKALCTHHHLSRVSDTADNDPILSAWADAIAMTYDGTPDSYKDAERKARQTSAYLKAAEETGKKVLPVYPEWFIAKIAPHLTIHCGLTSLIDKSRDTPHLSDRRLTMLFEDTGKGRSKCVHTHFSTNPRTSGVYAIESDVHCFG